MMLQLMNSLYLKCESVVDYIKVSLKVKFQVETEFSTNCISMRPLQRMSVSTIFVSSVEFMKLPSSSSSLGTNAERVSFVKLLVGLGLRVKFDYLTKTFPTSKSEIAPPQLEFILSNDEFVMIKLANCFFKGLILMAPLSYEYMYFAFSFSKKTVALLLFCSQYKIAPSSYANKCS